MNEVKYELSLPQMSDWKCYMFGSHKGTNGLIYVPIKGNEPNRFVRWMMKVCFACHWEKG